MDYGLIGKKLGHSFSKPIHEQLAGYRYELRELPTEEEFRAFMREQAFRAINVTIPYKRLVMEYCDVVDEQARAIGAVNTVVNRAGTLYGYNTDFAGAAWALARHGVALAGRTVLILGTGGTRRTLQAVAESQRAARVLVAGRSGGEGVLTYAQAARCRDVQVVVNCSPAGMWPACGECLVDLADWPALEAVFDAVYNPLETRLLWQARQRGAVAVNGLEMLVAQAKYAAEHFLGRGLPDSAMPEVHRQLCEQVSSLVLIGMPGCGKTRIGQLAAQLLGKRFVDMDDEVVRRAGMTIPELFAVRGEAAFRDLESQVAAELGAQGGLVVATGGGAVLRGENVRALRQNGVLVYLDRPLEQLAVGGGRPLSSSREAVEQLYRRRAPLYAQAAHVRVPNRGGPPREAADAVCAAYRQAVAGGVF